MKSQDARKFYTRCMKKAMEYVAAKSNCHHIHSVSWLQVGEGEYLDVSIETTDNLGSAYESWKVRVSKIETSYEVDHAERQTL